MDLQVVEMQFKVKKKTNINKKQTNINIQNKKQT